METVKEMTDQAVWIAHSLFGRGKTTGSSANISFRWYDEIYISCSGSCFGTLTADDFSVINLDNELIRGKKTSKESPLHLAMYRQNPKRRGVIHTHGTYSVLWSFLPHENTADCIPSYTPYLQMKLGPITLVPYEQPGSGELFRVFQECLSDYNGYLLKRHGAIVASDSLMDAFYCLEELEESARIAWELHLRKENNGLCTNSMKG